MYKPRGWSALLLGLILVGMSDVSMADRGYRGHGHVGVGIVVNPFWVGPAYYPGPYYYHPYYYPPYQYYYPPSVVVPDGPTEYIEREDNGAPAPAPAYWYYCADPRGYYPSVKQCPGGWRAVAPRPDTLPREER